MLLSVALCTYNGARFIEKQLLSILNQQLSVGEIVIRDDASTDETLPIVLSIAKAHPEISWDIKQNSETIGIIKNFESALYACRGDIVFLSDQDDLWDVEKTQKIITFFNQHPATSLVFSDAELIDETGKIISDKTLFDICGLRDLLPAWNSGLQFEIENVLQRLLGATFAVRRTFLQKGLPFHTEVKNYHDGQLAFLSVVDNCNGYVDDRLIKYRIHGNNVVGLGGNAGGRLSGKVMNAGSDLVEPRDVNPFFLLPCASPIKPRVRFYLKRNKYYARLFGKICLGGAILEYMKYYRRFWFGFYASDLLYGVSNRLRQRIVHTFCHRWFSVIKQKNA